MSAPKTDDEVATPRADMGVRSTPAAVSATAVGAAGPASSSSATEGRVTSEVATLPSVPQRKRGETDEARLGLVAQGNKGGQQVLGTCSPSATGSPEGAS